MLGANLKDAVLWNAKLQSACLMGANIECEVLRRANLEDVRLYGATITETTRFHLEPWGEKTTLWKQMDKWFGEALGTCWNLK